MKNIQIANAPCSWGVLEFDLPGKALGYAQVLDEIRDTGYAGTELGDWGFMPTDPEALRRELDARKLSRLGAFVQVAFANPQAHDKGAETAVRTAKLLAAVEGKSPFIVLADDNATQPVRTKKAGRITASDGLSDAQWAVFAKGVEQVASAVREQTGLRSVVHPHAAGFIETPDEIARLLQLTDPQLVGLCFDTGHYRFGGGDPVAGLRCHLARSLHLDFKHSRPPVHPRSPGDERGYFTAPP